MKRGDWVWPGIMLGCAIGAFYPVGGLIVAAIAAVMAAQLEGRVFKAVTTKSSLDAKAVIGLWMFLAIGAAGVAAAYGVNLLLAPVFVLGAWTLYHKYAPGHFVKGRLPDVQF